LDAWRSAIADVRDQPWFASALRSPLGIVARAAREAIKELRSITLEPGRGAMSYVGPSKAYDDWYRRDSKVLTHHESRAHMREDLHRYLFCACFGRATHESPKLRDFPKELYPSHRNVSKAVDGNMFDDRFRVQLADRPATTITAHISKDGHYYIHYDPLQCRSLTVREAARLQTFPDSYYFQGVRTEQYHQVGNAVPPLLARDIAGVVFQVLKKLFDT
jgi:DNA (cytosine-5)-methyltransferase 1